MMELHISWLKIINLYLVSKVRIVRASHFLKSTSRIATTFLCVLLSSCAGIGVISSSNPMENLNTAHTMFASEDRPLIAERLIIQSIGVFKDKNDNLGLGDSYREYAELLSSPSVSGKWRTYYERNGFLDGSTSYNNRENGATHYYRKALGAYGAAILTLEANHQYDKLTNAYYNAAIINVALGNIQEGCSNYNLALAAYSDNMEANPGVKPYAPDGSFEKFIDAKKKDIGCH